MDWEHLLAGLEAIAMHDHMPMHLGADLLQLIDEIKNKLAEDLLQAWKRGELVVGETDEETDMRIMGALRSARPDPDATA